MKNTFSERKKNPPLKAIFLTAKSLFFFCAENSKNIVDICDGDFKQEANQVGAFDGLGA